MSHKCLQNQGSLATTMSLDSFSTFYFKAWSLLDEAVPQNHAKQIFSSHRQYIQLIYILISTKHLFQLSEHSTHPICCKDKILNTLLIFKYSFLSYATACLFIHINTFSAWFNILHSLKSYFSTFFYCFNCFSTV